MTRLLVQFLVAVSLPMLCGLILSDDTVPGADGVDYPEHLPGPLTGGFGEQTCHSCHFDYELNDPRGELSVRGPGTPYIPGKSYKMEVSVEREPLGKAGFQMTARFADGAQAGGFTWEDDRIAITPVAGESTVYLQHSESGSNPQTGTKAVWTFTWTAPQTNPQPVIFNIAANAANGDLSEFGDWIYVKEFMVEPDRPAAGDR